MSTMDKLGRTLSALKLLHSKPENYKPTKNREKVALCLTVADLISSSNVRNTDNFLPVLSFTISSLLESLEDADSNTRLIIDESLNRIIRAVSDNHIQTIKLLNALLTMMKKSNNGRTVKAALWRFGELSHCIRPQKAKLYVQYLVPVLIKISEMRDEMVLETLGNALSSIFISIGLYSSENEIKILLRAFLRNLYSDSAYVRRSSAESIVAICRYCRQPTIFFMYTSRIILDALLRIQKDGIAEDGPLLGLFTCMRQILPYISKMDDECDKTVKSVYLSRDNDFLRLEYYWQIYRLCLYYCMSCDQNICVTSLETLHQLLQVAPLSLISCLTTTKGFSDLVSEHINLHASTLSLFAFTDVSGVTTNSVADELSSTNNHKLMSGRSVSSLISVGSTSDWNIIEYQGDNNANDKIGVSISGSLINIHASHFGNSDEEDERADVLDSTHLSISNRAISADNILHCEDQRDYNNCLTNRKFSVPTEKIILPDCSSITSDFIQIELDIGSVDDLDDVPLNYCTRNLVCAFLMQYNVSQKIRVSVISLTLQCVSQIFRMYPEAAFLAIEKNKHRSDEYFDIILEEILPYSKHEDQQIRGLSCVVVGLLMKSILVRNDYNRRLGFSLDVRTDLFPRLMDLLVEGIQNESSICVRHSLSGISSCIEPSLRSSGTEFVIPLFSYLMKLKDNSYWLVKVKLLELLGDLPYRLLNFVDDSGINYSDRIFNQIIIFLNDKDGRIRHAAAKSIVMYVSKAYYTKDLSKRAVIPSYMNKLANDLELRLKSKEKHIFTDFFLNEDIEYDPIVESFLSKVVYRFNEMLLNTSSKYLIAGLSEVLCLLSEKYPPLIYPKGWHLFLIATSEPAIKQSYCNSFELVICLLTCNPVTLDIDVHLNLLQTATRLFIALNILNLKKVGVPSPNADKPAWHYVYCKKVSALFELLLQHMMRLITIIANILQNTPLISSSGILSSSLIKSPSIENPVANWKPFESLSQKSKLSDGKSVEEKARPFGYYANIGFYLKLRELLQSLYNNYKVTLQVDSNDKFVKFTRLLLQCFTRVLNFVTLTESDRICEELLSLFKAFILFNPTETIRCILKLLKSVFGTNCLGDYIEEYSSEVESHQLGSQEQTTVQSVDDCYDLCFHTPFQTVSQFILEHSSHLDNNNRSSIRSWEDYETGRRRCINKYSKRSIHGNILPTYIKLFEPMVIQSLKQYTVSSNTTLQATVLSLLTELIQLKVNFCLLDPEQTFITYVLGQFQYIEETQLRNVDVLILPLFNFLIQLSNDKNSASLIYVPRIIQLCDCLIASENTVLNCIVALSPVIDYIFVSKSTHNVSSTEVKEIETQRDVLFAMILRLVSYPQSFRLLYVIILETKSDEKKLARSKQIVDALFPSLAESNVNYASEDVFLSTVDLFLSLHPLSYTSTDLLSAVFTIYITRKEKIFTRWLSNIVACLTVLFCKCDENTLLESTKLLYDHKYFLQEYKDVVVSDPLNAYHPEVDDILPAKAFVRFLFQVLHIVAERVSENKYMKILQNELLTQKLLSHLLILLHHIVDDKFVELKFEISKQDQEDFGENNLLHQITDVFVGLIIVNPILVLRWYALLVKLNHPHRAIDKAECLIKTRNSICSENESSTDTMCGDCLNSAAFKRGLFYLSCGGFMVVLVRHFMDEGRLNSFLENNLDEIVESIDEYPLHELLQSIQFSRSASEIFINFVNGKLSDLLEKDAFVAFRLLQCLEYVHSDVSGRVLRLCIQPRIINNAFLPISKISSTLAMRNAEYLLTLQNRREIKQHLSLKDLQSLICMLTEFESYSRNLLTLLTKIVAQYFHRTNLNPCGATVELKVICSVDVNKEWFLNQVRRNCCTPSCSPIVCARLLGQLSSGDIDSALKGFLFNANILRYCLTVGTELTLQNVKKNGSIVENSSVSDLYVCAESRMVWYIDVIELKLPERHRTYKAQRREILSSEEREYVQILKGMFDDKLYTDFLVKLIPVVAEYVKSVKQLSARMDVNLVISENIYHKLAFFSVHCAEMVLHSLLAERSKFLFTNAVVEILWCLLSIAEMDSVSTLYTVPQIGSLVSLLYSLTENLYNEPLDYSPNKLLPKISEDPDVLILAHSSHLLSILIGSLITPAAIGNKAVNCKHTHLSSLIKKFVTVLAHSTSVYSYARIPLETWEHLSVDDVAIHNNQITVTTLPEDMMQDHEFLRIFVKRITFIGWKTRQQFEEWWVALLTVLSSASSPNISAEESLALSQNAGIAINAITSILVQTIFQPTPGNSVRCSVLHISRNNIINMKRNKWTQKLKNISDNLDEIASQNDVLKPLHRNLNVNLERLHNSDKYDYNQISVEYLYKVHQWRSQSERQTDEKIMDPLECLFRHREQLMQDIGVASQSCIHFLLDYYSQWFTDTDNVQLRTTLEIMKSLIIISDFFTEPAQFTWLFDTCMMLHSKHPIEDDIMHQYIVLGICKSASVMIPSDNESKQSTIRILMSSLNSAYYPMQIASLHGLLYLLESIFKKNQLNTSELVSTDFEEQILAIAKNYAAGNLDEELLERCSEHAILCIIAISFYLIEHTACGESGEQIFESLCTLTTKTCKMNLYLLHATLIQGFYNLTLLGNDLILMKRNLLPLISDTLSLPECTAEVSLINLQLLLALMYASEFEESLLISENDNTFFDTDKLITKMEKTAIFFDRIKRGFRMEAEIISNFLPALLHDFFPPSEVLNKTINEFLSPQQPHLDLMSDVVFKVFQHVIQQSKLPLLREWVLTLLNNFIQGYSLPVASFYLTCFFISASTNEWLIALFPKLKSRLGLWEQEDRVLLGIAAKQFYYQLTSDQKVTFMTTFKTASKTQARSPFADVISVFE